MINTSQLQVTKEANESSMLPRAMASRARPESIRRRPKIATREG
jgi:hypothetical protein